MILSSVVITAKMDSAFPAAVELATVEPAASIVVATLAIKAARRLENKLGGYSGCIFLNASNDLITSSSLKL